MTICRIERNDAEKRIEALLSGAPTAKPTATIVLSAGAPPVNATATSDASAQVDLEELSRDAIRQHIARKFAGHNLAVLVEAVLTAQGYKTYLSPPGPDGGVEVLAGQGGHGFDGARIAVQVKSGSIEVDTSIFREFRGVMDGFGANQGLIVSWGGFKNSVKRDIPSHFFKIRMWDADDLIAEIVRHYDKFPATIQAALPLKRVWMLVGAIDNADE